MKLKPYTYPNIKVKTLSDSDSLMAGSNPTNAKITFMRNNIIEGNPDAIDAKGESFWNTEDSPDDWTDEQN